MVRIDAVRQGLKETGYVEGESVVELVINAQTALMLGLAVPSALLSVAEPVQRPSPLHQWRKA
jgi:hypothetical protein